MCRKRPFATHASADPAGQPWSSAPEGSRPRSRRPPSCPDAGHARRRPFVHRRPSSRRRIESPAGERNHPAALAHRPEPPAASALVAATAGWSARALPAFEDGWWRTHGLPPKSITGEQVDLSVHGAGLRDADESLHVPARSRCRLGRNCRASGSRRVDRAQPGPRPAGRARRRRVRQRQPPDLPPRCRGGGRRWSPRSRTTRVRRPLADPKGHLNQALPRRRRTTDRGAGGILTQPVLGESSADRDRHDRGHTSHLARDVRIEELQQEHERQNHEVDRADLSTGADERRDLGHASQPACRTMPPTPPDPSLRLPVRALGEYVCGGRVDAMRRLLRGR